MQYLRPTVRQEGKKKLFKKMCSGVNGGEERFTGKVSNRAERKIGLLKDSIDKVLLWQSRIISMPTTLTYGKRKCKLSLNTDSL